MNCVHGQAGYCGARCLLDEPVKAAEAELTRLRADRAALVARVEELEQANGCMADYQEALAGYQDRVAALRAQTQRDAELAAEWKAQAEAYRVELEVTRDKLAAWKAAEARVRELEARCDVLRRTSMVSELERQLAAANALLQKGKQFVGRTNGVREKWCDDADHLSAQPSASTCTCLGCVDGKGCMFIKPAAPTDHDRAVLEASNAVADGALRWLMAGGVSVDLRDWAQAELARREALKARESGR